MFFCGVFLINFKFKYTSSVNSFDEVRFILAFVVLVAHTSTLASVDDYFWFSEFFDSNFAVKGFFTISGFLVTKSFIYSRDNISYFKKRIMRIYPAYITVIFYCIFVGFFTSNFSIYDFFSDSGFFRYLFFNLFFLNFIEPNLPGSIPFSSVGALNGSLWTIKVELMLYFVVPFLFLLHKKIGPLATLVFCFVFGAAWFLYFLHLFDHPFGPAIARQFPGQLPFFVFGSMLYFIKFSQVKTALFFVTSFFYIFYFNSFFDQSARDILNMIFYPIFIIFISKSSFLYFNISRFGDLSYGIYLYHFPTIQLLEHFGFYRLYPYSTFVFSVFVILLLSFCSWHLIEKRFLKRSFHKNLSS